MKRLMVVAGIGVLLMVGCGTTQQAAVQEQPAVCGFLGTAACSYLKPGGEGQAGLRWVNTTADVTQYKKVLIDVVGFFGDPEKADAEAQLRLTSFFLKVLNEELGKRYEIVNENWQTIGPGVLKIQAAILDAEAATPGARSVSMAVPRVFSSAYRGASGKWPFAGGIQAAVRISDWQTGKIIGAAVDNRLGGGSMENIAVWQWGDAEHAMTEWAKLLSEKLYGYTSTGKQP